MNGHLEIFSFPQAIENSRQFLLLRTDISQKTVVGCPWLNLSTEWYNCRIRIPSDRIITFNILASCEHRLLPFSLFTKYLVYFFCWSYRPKWNYVFIGSFIRQNKSVDKAGWRNSAFLSRALSIVLICSYFKNVEWTKVHDIQLAKEILVSEPYRFKPRTVWARLPAVVNLRTVNQLWNVGKCGNT